MQLKIAVCLAILWIPIHLTAAEKTSLVGTEWVLEDLAGAGVLDTVQATLSFPEPNKAAGRGSCNRFAGTVTVSGNSIKFGPLMGTRMACPEAVMNQETKYLAALAAAERFERSEHYLLIYCANSEKPLRFTGKDSKTTQTPKNNPQTLEALLGRIWRLESESSKGAPGSIYVFLANGTLLETSCKETYRVATWTAETASSPLLRVVEDGQPAFTASVIELTSETLSLHQKLTRTEETRDLHFKAIDRETTCPDLN